MPRKGLIDPKDSLLSGMGSEKSFSLTGKMALKTLQTNDCIAAI
jgi:hypothetical protein